MDINKDVTWDICFTHQFEKDVKRLSKLAISDWLGELNFLKMGPKVSSTLLKSLNNNSKGFRWRKGDLRVIFRVTGQPNTILLLSAGHKKSIYKNSMPGNLEVAGNLDELTFKESQAKSMHVGEPRHIAEQSAFSFESRFDGSIVEELFVDEADLFLLDIPSEYYEVILDADRIESLSGKGIPSLMLKRLESYLTAPGVHHVGKLYSLDQADRIDAIANYTLDRFLISLDPQQKSIVDKPFDGGPWLIRGGPGTGKTLISLARMKRICREGVGQDLISKEPIKIGFVTYNKKLLKTAETMFRAICNDYSGAKIEFLTLDSLVYRLLKYVKGRRIVSELDQKTVLEDVFLTFNNERWDKADIESLYKRRGISFLLEEFNEIILGADLIKQQDYRDYNRLGRKTRINRHTERILIHDLYRCWAQEMKRRHWTTFPGKRLAAEKMISSGKLEISQQQYDFLFVDELQDLPVVSVRLLAHMVKHTKNLTFAADTAQSIFLKSPTWSNISKDIRFHAGNSFILRKSYRMTKEIGSAVRPLRLNADDEGKDVNDMEECFVTGEKPCWLNCEIEKHFTIAAMLAHSLIQNNGVNPGQIAIITPDKASTGLVKNALEQYGVSTDAIDNRKVVAIDQESVHILHAHVAKGLQYPFVITPAVTDDKYPHRVAMSYLQDADQRAEEQDKARRLLYVALSRAVRGLWLLTDPRFPSPLLENLNQDDWDVQLYEGG